MWWVLLYGLVGKPGAFAAQVPLLRGGGMLLLRVVALTCVECRRKAGALVGFC